MRVPLCPAVRGHIADSVRDHQPGSGGWCGRSVLGEEAEEAVYRTAGMSGVAEPTVRMLYTWGRIGGVPYPGPGTSS
jgi:hypothetical protein